MKEKKYENTNKTVNFSIYNPFWITLGRSGHFIRAEILIKNIFEYLYGKGYLPKIKMIAKKSITKKSISSIFNIFSLLKYIKKITLNKTVKYNIPYFSEGNPKIIRFIIEEEGVRYNEILLNILFRIFLGGSYYELSYSKVSSDVIIANGCERYVLKPFIKSKGKIKIYLSNNFEYDFRNKREYLYLEKLIIKISDFILVTSKRDFLKYVYILNAPEDKVKVFYNIYATYNELNNIFPILRNLSKEKENNDEWPSYINIIFPKADSKNLIDFIKFIKDLLRVSITIRIFGLPSIKKLNPLRRIVNKKLKIMPYIKDYKKYILTLAEGNYAINYAKNIGGTNLKMYDYLLAGNIVFSTAEGLRGDSFPNSYSFVDIEDLVSKIESVKWNSKVFIDNFNFIRKRARENIKVINKIFDSLL